MDCSPDETTRLDDTIVAVASSPGTSSRAVLRISGAGPLSVMRAVCVDHEVLKSPRGFSGQRVEVAVGGAVVPAWACFFRAFQYHEGCVEYDWVVVCPLCDHLSVGFNVFDCCEVCGSY